MESKANWANEISRGGAQGNWAPRNTFSIRERGSSELLTLLNLAVARFCLLVGFKADKPGIRLAYLQWCLFSLFMPLKLV